MSCRVDLFSSGRVIGMLFFEDHELADAEASAMTALLLTGADRAEIRDCTAALFFRHPGGESSGTRH